VDLLTHDGWGSTLKTFSYIKEVVRSEQLTVESDRLCIHKFNFLLKSKFLLNHIIKAEMECECGIWYISDLGTGV